jgi:hypothetical protein
MLSSLFRQLIDRVKALLALAAAQEMQAEALSRQAERKAELLRKAKDYEAEGLSAVAEQLRREAELLDAPQQLAGVLAPAELLATAPQAPALPAAPQPQPQPAPGSGRKGR